jgi:hypothetical protein
MASGPSLYLPISCGPASWFCLRRAVINRSIDPAGLSEAPMSENAAKSDPRINGVLKTAWAMKASDLSVLDAALQHGSGVMLTTKGSDNDRLWSQLTEFGMMRAADVPAELLRQVEDAKGYELIDKGRDKVPVLFEILKLAKIRMQLMQVEDEMARKIVQLMA